LLAAGAISHKESQAKKEEEIVFPSALFPPKDRYTGGDEQENGQWRRPPRLPLLVTPC